MQRIDHATAATDPVTGEPVFTEGDPQTMVPPTVVTAPWLNAVQEELANAIERKTPLDPGNPGQLAAALNEVDASLEALRADVSNAVAHVMPVDPTDRFQLAKTIAALADSLYLSLMVEGPTNTGGFNAFAANEMGSHMVALCKGTAPTDPLVITQNSGRQWHNVPTTSGTELGAGPDAELLDIAYDGSHRTDGQGRYVAVGVDGTIRQAAAGPTKWTRRTPDDDWVAPFQHVHYAAFLDQWLIGGSSGNAGTLQASSDGGLTWGALSPPVANGYGPFASDGSVVLCATPDGILRSVNGTVWTYATLDAPLDVPIAALSRVPGGWLALLSSGYPREGYISTDSVNWVRTSLGLGQVVSAKPFIDARSGAVLDGTSLATSTALGSYAKPVPVFATSGLGGGTDSHARRTHRRWIASAGNTLYFSGVQLY